MQRRVAGLCVLALGLAVAAHAAQDLFAGTWKLNVEKSKFNPGPAMLRAKIVIDPRGKVTVNEVNGAGEARDWSYTPKSGHEAAVTGIPNSSVVEKRLGPRVREDKLKLNGVSYTGRAELDRNDRVMKYTLKGANSKGQPVEDVLVFEKQGS